MSDEMQWRDPPVARASTARYGKLKTFVEALKAHPGKWALYPNTSHTQAATTNRRYYPGTEWTTRKRDDGTCDLYGRWVGTEDAP